jgi:hypothetical protein
MHSPEIHPMIHSPNINRYYFLKTVQSITLKEELTRVEAMSDDQVFERLRKLSLDNYYDYNYDELINLL